MQDWVPIISRDRERQRRQAVQGPLSDAYLAGMPSKRRKVVTSSKPHGNLARVISGALFIYFFNMDILAHNTFVFISYFIMGWSE